MATTHKCLLILVQGWKVKLVIIFEVIKNSSASSVVLVASCGFRIHDKNEAWASASCSNHLLCGLLVVQFLQLSLISVKSLLVKIKMLRPTELYRTTQQQQLQASHSNKETVKLRAGSRVQLKPCKFCCCSSFQKPRTNHNTHTHTQSTLCCVTNIQSLNSLQRLMAILQWFFTCGSPL